MRTYLNEDKEEFLDETYVFSKGDIDTLKTRVRKKRKRKVKLAEKFNEVRKPLDAEQDKDEELEEATTELSS